MKHGIFGSNKCYGITQDPITKDFIIIMKNYLLDDLKYCMIYHLLHKSGNKIVDDFIKYTQSELFIQSTQSKLEFNMMMEFVPYNQFEDIEFIAEGGFSKVYKATWINGHIQRWNKEEINFK